MEIKSITLPDEIFDNTLYLIPKDLMMLIVEHAALDDGPYKTFIWQKIQWRKKEMGKIILDIKEDCLTREDGECIANDCMHSLKENENEQT